MSLVGAEDVAGFIAAQDELREELGSPCTFRVPQVPTWPGGTKINPDTGRPFDATVVQANAEFTELTATVLVVLKKGSMLRPQSSEQWSALGLASGMDLILDMATADNGRTAEATEMVVLGLAYDIMERKPFGIAGTTYRFLIYGQEK